MHEVAEEPFTGRVPVVPKRPAEDEEGTYVLLPVVGEPDATVAVFSDGSYSRWWPRLSGQSWELGASVLCAAFGLMDVVASAGF